MKTYTKFLSVIAMSVGALGCFAGVEPGTITHKSLQIIRTVEPVFPDRATPVTSTGRTVIAINVNSEGQLVDSLVLSYTRKEFADEAMRVLKQWKYIPASLDGKPISVVTELDFQFQATGVVVSLSIMDSFEHVLNPLLREKYEFAPCGLKEIDRIPMPINVISPRYPLALAKKGVQGEVVVVFYIDEQGRVRMPSIQDASNMDLADLALEAISQWRFEPPTRHGEPVLVRASQTFRFNPNAGAPVVEAKPPM